MWPIPFLSSGHILFGDNLTYTLSAATSEISFPRLCVQRGLYGLRCPSVSFTPLVSHPSDCSPPQSQGTLSRTQTADLNAPGALLTIVQVSACEHGLDVIPSPWRFPLTASNPGTSQSISQPAHLPSHQATRLGIQPYPPWKVTAKAFLLHRCW